MRTDVRILLFSGGGLASNLIRWQTRSPWSHAAIEISGDVWEACQFKKVVRRDYTELRQACRKNKTKLYAISVSLLPYEKLELVTWLDQQVGKDYDWSSVFRFVTRQQARRESAEVWFCSELVFAAFKHIDKPLLARTEPWEVSPGLLARTTLGHTFEPVVT